VFLKELLSNIWALGLLGWPHQSNVKKIVWKSCWAGLISGWVTILVTLCCMSGEVRLPLCSTLAPPTSAIVHRLSFSRSQPDLRVFLHVLLFFSLSKIDSQPKTCVLCSRIKQNNLRQPLRRLSHAFGRYWWAASFAVQPLGPVVRKQINLIQD